MMENKNQVKIILFYDDFTKNEEKKIEIFQKLANHFKEKNVFFG